MKPCPTCGVRLSEPLVDAIENPSREESCPEDIRRKMKSRRNSDSKQALYDENDVDISNKPTIQTLALLGSTMSSLMDEMEPPLNV